ncbi:hypothetical protein D3C78_1423550 [compost metagenome]
MPAAAVASTRESMSLADSLKDALGPRASSAVMTMEYGSSPVDAALHQTRQGVFAGLLRKWLARMSKWCCSRKKAVRLVVSAFTNSCHSGPSVLSSQER